MAAPRPASLARRALPALAIAGLSGGILVKLDNPAPAAASGGIGNAATRAGRSPTTTTGAADDSVQTPTTVRPRTTTTVAGSARTTAPAAKVAPTTTPARPAATTIAPGTRAPAAPTTRATVAPAAPAPTAADAGACTAEPVAGPTVSTRWGPVQVAAVFSTAGALCDVEVLQYPSDHRKSVAINQRALPMLTREAVAAGSADIDIVSGATITSDAYATSLQAILDRR